MKDTNRKLRGRILEKYGTQEMFAKAVGQSRQIISLKLNNKVDMSKTEISKWLKLLDIPESEVGSYFF